MRRGLAGPTLASMCNWHPQTRDAAFSSEDLAGVMAGDACSNPGPHLVLALHPLHIDVQVQLPHAANDGLPTLSVYTDLQSSSRGTW